MNFGALPRQVRLPCDNGSTPAYMYHCIIVSLYHCRGSKRGAWSAQNLVVLYFFHSFCFHVHAYVCTYVPCRKPFLVVNVSSSVVAAPRGVFPDARLRSLWRVSRGTFFRASKIWWWWILMVTGSTHTFSLHSFFIFVAKLRIVVVGTRLGAGREEEWFILVEVRANYVPGDIQGCTAVVVLGNGYSSI